MMQRFIGGSSPAARFKTGIRALFTILVMLAAIPAALHAQAYFGAVVGNVSDPSGAAVVGAKVTIVEPATGTKYNTVSSSIGAYQFPQLPAGVYTLHISAPTFKGFTANAVEVHVSTNTTLNATLQPGAVSDTVTVQADAIQVETTSAAAGEVITGAQVRELPLNGENFVGLTQLSPGVSAASSFDGTGKGLEGGVNFSVNGNPYTNNLFLVDGVNNNDMGSGRTILVYPAVDTISEFKMIRNSYGSEYGQASGAIISITTKSGQNQFHGGFFYSGRNNALDTNDWVSNDNPVSGKVIQAKLRKSDFGYNASGPIKKDKLFIWWNQEWDKEIRGSSFATCNPTDAEGQGDFSAYTQAASNGLDQCGASVPGLTNVSGTTTTVNQGFPSWAGSSQKLSSYDKAGYLIGQFYPSPNYNSNQTMVDANGHNWASAINNGLNWSEWNVRPDYDINKSNRATFRWTQDSWTNPAPNNPSNFWGESSYPTVQSNWSQPSKSVLAKLSSTITSSMVNDFEFGYGNNAIITTLAGTRASIVTQLDTAYPAAFPSSIKQPGEFFGQWGGLNPYGSYQGQASMWNIAPYKNHEDLYTVQDNLSKVKGNHLLKVGVFFSDNIKVEDGGNGADRPGVPGTVYCNTKNGVNVTGPGNPACVATNNPLANLLVPGTGTQPQTFANIGENSIDATAQVKWHDIEFYAQDSWKIRRNVTLDYGFRYSFFREPYSADNKWANWDPTKWSATLAAANPGDACNGLIIVPGSTPCADANKFMASLGVTTFNLSSGTPGPTKALVNQANGDIAPRVGIAWDIFGNGKTAVRLGGGEFFQREIVGIDEGMEKGTPFTLSTQTTRTMDVAPSLSNASVSPNYAKETTGVTPASWQWNATLEQQVAKNTTVEVSYVANTGIHLTSMEAFNAIPQSQWANAATSSSGTGVNPYRAATNFGAIQGFARHGHATYNSMQALFRSQVGPSTFQAAYTYSKSVGDVAMDDSSGTADAQATTVNGDSKLDKGNTNINRPNIFVANEVYYLPKLAKQNLLVRETVGGWQVNSILTAAQGSSLTVFANGGYNNGSISQLIGTGYNGNNRPLLTGTSCNAGEKQNQILNAAAFTLVGYKLGTAPTSMEPRGYCHGASTIDWDGQLAKNWDIREKYRIKFSMDFFDLLNHPNFNTSGLEGTGYTPSTITCGNAPCSATNNTITANSAVTGFGSVQSMQAGHGNRELQYSLKFSF